VRSIVVNSLRRYSLAFLIFLSKQLSMIVASYAPLNSDDIGKMKYVWQTKDYHALWIMVAALTVTNHCTNFLQAL
jgi:hypothetical protein